MIDIVYETRTEGKEGQRQIGEPQLGRGWKKWIHLLQEVQLSYILEIELLKRPLVTASADILRCIRLMRKYRITLRL